MGAFGAMLGQIGKQAATEAGAQVGSGIGGVLGYGIGELFGHNRRARRQQLQQQDKLNALSYEWNKRQMNYAQELEKGMYNYTFEKNKPENLKNLYKEAGLNPALMYGTSAGGVQGTSVGGGRTGNYNSQAASEGEIIQGNMALQQMGLQMAKLRSEIDVNKSVAERNRSGARLDNAKTKTEDEQRDKFIAKLYYDGKISFLESLLRDLKFSGVSGDEPNYSMQVIGDKFQLYGNIQVPTDIKDSLFGREIMSAILASEALADNHIANAALTNEKLTWYFKEMMADVAMKDANAAEAKAKELQNLWQIGEHVNWKTFLESGVDAVNTIMNLLSTAYGKGLTKGLGNTTKPTGHSTQPYQQPTKKTVIKYDY